MRDGRILRGPIKFRAHRVYMNSKQRSRKKNKLFELVGRYRRKAKIQVPYYKKQYARKWEMKSLPFWYREHWGNLEIEQETPLAFDRRTSPRQLHKSQIKAQGKGHYLI